MRSGNGRWVNGEDFFNRDVELKLLKQRVQEGSHVLLTGQRRMGKTSIARELGRRLKQEDWIFLYTDVEDAQNAEDVIAEIAEAGHPVQGMWQRFTESLRNYLPSNVEEISAYDFKLKFRAGLDAGSWKQRGEELLQTCANNPRPVLLVIDELPIFLNRILNRDENGKHLVEDFLGWFRRQLQQHNDGQLVVMVSGSIGLEPLVQRLGLSDRINHLEPTFRIGAWNEQTSSACLQALAQHYRIDLQAGVTEKVHALLGLGIPHHVQSFFTRLREDAVMHDRETVSVNDVDRLYQNGMLGPSGQNDLSHYEDRLKEALDEQTHQITLLILSEAAITGSFSVAAEKCLFSLYKNIASDVDKRVRDALDVLQHDGYLHKTENGFAFQSNLLKDWWCARYQGHYQPLCEQTGEGS